MDPNKTQELLSQKRTEIGQRYAELPTKFASPADDSQLQAMSGQEMDKIKELYEHDKRLAERYANPESEAYLDDPYAREKARATQSQATLGEIGTIQSQREKRKSTLEDALSRGLQLFLAGIQGLEKESDFLQSQIDKEDKKKEKKSDTLLEILKGTGGAIPNELADALGIARGTRFPTPQAPGAITPSQKMDDFRQTATSFGQMIDNGVLTWGQAWNTLAEKYPEFKDQIDTYLGGSAKVTGTAVGPVPNFGQPIREETGRAKPGYYESRNKIVDTTQEYIAEIPTYTTKAEALAALETYKVTMVEQGVDIEAIRRAIEAYFSKGVKK